jgi:hypothetical protein
MNIPVIFSTVTGNAAKLAFAACEVLGSEAVGPYNVSYILGGEGTRVDFVTDFVLEHYDTFVFVYWCDKGTADENTCRALCRLKDKNIIMLGALGAESTGDYAQKIKARTALLAQKDNRLTANLLVQCSIDPFRTIHKRISESRDEPRYDEIRAAYAASSSKPELSDLNLLKKQLAEAIESLRN